MQCIKLCLKFCPYRAAIWPLCYATPTNYQQKFFSSRQIIAPRLVFDRKAKKLQKHQSALSPNCSIYDYLKEEAANMLCDRVCDVKRSFSLALDVGCGKGFLSKNISSEDGAEAIIQGDICEASLLKTAASELPLNSIVFDEEKLPFRDNSFDIALSSLSLHWVNDLPGCFKEILRVLKPDGCFIGVMFGAETLFELRCSLQLAETEREGGIAPHVSPMIQGHQLANLVSGAGFNLVTLDFDQLVVNYPTMFELMEDLQGMGENSALRTRKMLHRDTLIAAAAIYQAMYGNPDNLSVPATFQMLFMIGWKPHPSQQQPMKRGEAPKGFNIKENPS